MLQTIVVVTTSTAASSQRRWLSPESLTALTAAASGFAGLGESMCPEGLRLRRGAPYFGEVATSSKRFETLSGRARSFVTTSGAKLFGCDPPAPVDAPPLPVGTVSTYWLIEGVPGGTGGGSAARADAEKANKAKPVASTTI